MHARNLILYVGILLVPLQICSAVIKIEANTYNGLEPYAQQLPMLHVCSWCFSLVPAPTISITGFLVIASWLPVSIRLILAVVSTCSMSTAHSSDS